MSENITLLTSIGFTPFLSAMSLLFNCCTNAINFGKEDTLILKDGHRLKASYVFALTWHKIFYFSNLTVNVCPNNYIICFEKKNNFTEILKK